MAIYSYRLVVDVDAGNAEGAQSHDPYVMADISMASIVTVYMAVTISWIVMAYIVMPCIAMAIHSYRLVVDVDAGVAEGV